MSALLQSRRQIARNPPFLTSANGQNWTVISLVLGTPRDHFPSDNKRSHPKETTISRGLGMQSGLFNFSIGVGVMQKGV